MLQAFSAATVSILKIMSILPQQFLVILVLLVLTLFKEGHPATIKRYYIPDKPGNWFQAREKCHEKGMQMATIQSFAENSALGQYVEETNKFNKKFSSFWIGGSDLAEEGTFTWFATGRLMSYENWSPGEPSNDNNGTNENCLQFVYNPEEHQRWTWNDNHCMFRFYGICESPELACEDDF